MTPGIREALTMILESQGYEVVPANDGIEGLAMLKAENPNLMILDLLMPKMDGFIVCEELQEPSWSKFKSTPILVLSSVREEPIRRPYELETALELGVDDYVEKPVSPDVLLERVGILISRKKT
ncbi:response regulator transcription factor [Chloroflexota bacterium]